MMRNRGLFTYDGERLCAPLASRHPHSATVMSDDPISFNRKCAKSLPYGVSFLIRSLQKWWQESRNSVRNDNPAIPSVY